MTTAPAPDAYHLLYKPHGLPVDDALKAETITRLTQSNPVMALTFDDFVALLALIVTCQRTVHGRAKTKTTIQLQNGLEVLQGRQPLPALGTGESTFWDWTGMAALNMEPTVAFVYMRLLRELHSLQKREACAS